MEDHVGNTLTENFTFIDSEENHFLNSVTNKRTLP